MPKRLYFFTQSFPYSIANEDSFISPEINRLGGVFDEVNIVPGLDSGGKAELLIDHNLNLEYARFLKEIGSISRLSKMVQGLFTSHLYKELFLSYRKITSLKRLMSLLIGAYDIKVRLNWFQKNIPFSDEGGMALYTYWFTRETYALAIFAKHKNVKVFSRAHGIDVYEDRNNGYFPFRRYALSLVSKIFVISKFGSDYIKSRYPKLADKVTHSYLGTINEGNDLSNRSEDGVLRVFSCSSLTGIKRVPLIFESLKHICTHNASMSIEWTHCGDGELMNELKSQITEVLGLTVRLLGHLSNENVLTYYKESPIDVFLHVSSTEGLPFVMMEALSHGVPVIATKVGGVSEIVINEVTGYLLSPSPSKEEVAGSVKDFSLLSPSKRQELSLQAQKHWQTNFNANINYEIFLKHFN